MKKIKLMVAMFLFATSAIVFNSCSQEEVMDFENPNSEISTFSKTFKIFDESGLNYLEILATCDDKSILDQYKSEMFKLSLHKEKPIPTNIVEQNIEEEYDEDLNNSAGKRVSFVIKNKNFESEYIGYSINVDVKFEEDLRLPWTYNDWENAVDVSFTITRHSWNRVYYKYSVKQDGEWLYKVSTYTKLSLGSPITKHVSSEVEKTKVYVQYKRESNFTLSFFKLI